MRPLLLIGFAIAVFVGIIAHHRSHTRQTHSNSPASTTSEFKQQEKQQRALLSKNRAPIVIILNGPSTAGKSSIQKELQAIFEAPLLAMGIDSLFVKFIPQKYFTQNQTENSVIWTTTTTDKRNKPVCTLHFGPDGLKMIDGMLHAMMAYAQAGNDMVIDFIAYNPKWLAKLQTSLRSTNLFIIKVTAPLAILEQREKDRNIPQIIGHVRSHYDSIHAGIAYDLELDTAQLNCAQCAQRIYELVLMNLAK